MMKRIGLNFTVKLWPLFFLFIIFYLFMKFVQCTGNEPNSSLANSLEVTFHLWNKNQNSVNAKWMWSGDIKTVINVFKWLQGCALNNGRREGVPKPACTWYEWMWEVVSSHMAQVMSGCGGFLAAWGELAYMHLLGWCFGSSEMVLYFIKMA